MRNILEVKNICKSFGAFALQDVSFSVPEGFVMGFIGPNGAGKTTTIKTLLGMIRPDAGSFEIFGQPGLRYGGAYKEQVGVVMEQPFYVDEWKVSDVEKALMPFYQTWDRGRYAQLLDTFHLEQSKRVKDLSRGMKVKLMLAAALSHDAKLLILDEPTSGLDPLARDELLDLLRAFMQRENRAVLFSTHITSDLEKIADYITYINDGKIAFTGPRDGLLEKYHIIRGGQGDLMPEQKRHIYGLREHSAGFEGMILAEDIGRFSGDIAATPASLDEIIVHLNQGETRGEVLL